MKVLVYFQPSPKHDNFEGARMRKTIKGALEVINVKHTSNIYDDYDVENGYVMNCRGCGKRIFLCDGCSHADDNYRSGFCDWHVARKNLNGEVGKCFRGVTINRI